jgi:hypothetical protein
MNFFTKLYNIFINRSKKFFSPQNKILEKLKLKIFKIELTIIKNFFPIDLTKNEFEIILK